MKFFRILIVAVPLFLIGQADAQQMKAQVEMKKRFFLQGRVFIPDQYLLLMTSPLLGTNPDLTVQYFQADGTLAWTKTIPTQFNVMNQRNELISSPDGNTIYVIHQQIYGYANKPHHITTLTRTGEEKKFTVEGRKELGEHLLNIFCDDKYLYYLASENGNEFSDKQKKDERLILNRFDKSNFSYKRVVLNLPAIEGSDRSSFWEFIGQRGNEKFLASMHIATTSGGNKFTVVTIDSDGNVTNNQAIETTVDAGTFMMPSRASYGGNGTHSILALNDFGFSLTTQKTSWNTHAAALGEITYDADNNCFYSYGLVGSKPFSERAVMHYEGLYVHKISRGGQAIWRLQVPPGDELMKEKYYKVQGFREDRLVGINSLLDGGLQVSINFQDKRYSLDISSDGLASDTLKKIIVQNGRFISRGPVKSEAFIKSNSKNGTVFSVWQQSDSELLFKFDEKTDTIEVFRF